MSDQPVTLSVVLPSQIPFITYSAPFYVSNPDRLKHDVYDVYSDIPGVLVDKTIGFESIDMEFIPDGNYCTLFFWVSIESIAVNGDVSIPFSISGYMTLDMEIVLVRG